MSYTDCFRWVAALLCSNGTKFKSGRSFKTINVFQVINFLESKFTTYLTEGSLIHNSWKMLGLSGASRLRFCSAVWLNCFIFCNLPRVKLRKPAINKAKLILVQFNFAIGFVNLAILGTQVIRFVHVIFGYLWIRYMLFLCIMLIFWHANNFGKYVLLCERIDVRKWKWHRNWKLWTELHKGKLTFKDEIRVWNNSNKKFIILKLSPVLINIQFCSQMDKI